MSDMTWKEFKDAVDAALKDTGEGYRGISITVRDGIEVLS